jgi:drug/metabolite transporter (DMT)-like permease
MKQQLLTWLRHLKTTSPSNLVGAALVLVGAILYSSKAIFVKLAYAYEVEAVILLALRMLFSFPVYALIAFTAKIPAGATALRPWDYVKMAVVGIMGYYLASLCDFIGLQYITASMERLVLYIYPTLVLLISWLVLRKRILPIQWIALCLAYLGISIVLLGDVSLQGQTDLWLGAGWVFLAALFYAAYLVGNGQLVVRIGTRRFTAFSMLAASLGVFAHSLISVGGHWPELPWEVYGYGLLMAMIATVVPSFMITEGIRRIGAGSSAIIGSIGPVSTIVLAYFFLGERLNAIQWLGTLVVVAGILLISLRKENKTQAAASAKT